LLGGAVLPWLAGYLAQHIALWTLWPYAISLTVVQLAIWRMLVGRLQGSAITRHPG
jgi:fucose permease